MLQPILGQYLSKEPRFRLPIDVRVGSSCGTGIESVAEARRREERVGVGMRMSRAKIEFSVSTRTGCLDKRGGMRRYESLPWNNCKTLYAIDLSGANTMGYTGLGITLLHSLLRRYRVV